MENETEATSIKARLRCEKHSDEASVSAMSKMHYGRMKQAVHSDGTSSTFEWDDCPKGTKRVGIINPYESKTYVFKGEAVAVEGPVSRQYHSL